MANQRGHSSLPPRALAGTATLPFADAVLRGHQRNNAARIKPLLIAALPAIGTEIQAATGPYRYVTRSTSRGLTSAVAGLIKGVNEVAPSSNRPNAEQLMATAAVIRGANPDGTPKAGWRNVLGTNASPFEVWRTIGVYAAARVGAKKGWHGYRHYLLSVAPGAQPDWDKLLSAVISKKSAPYFAAAAIAEKGGMLAHSDFIIPKTFLALPTLALFHHGHA